MNQTEVSTLRFRLSKQKKYNKMLIPQQDNFQLFNQQDKCRSKVLIYFYSTSQPNSSLTSNNKNKLIILYKSKRSNNKLETKIDSKNSKNNLKYRLFKTNITH